MELMAVSPSSAKAATGISDTVMTAASSRHQILLRKLVLIMSSNC